MAEVFKKVGGRKLTKIVAYQPEIQVELERKARRMAMIAKAILAKHRDTGQSKITVTKGRLDWYVNLEDDAALPIEFGGAYGRGGIAPLRRAAAEMRGGVL